MRLLLSIIPALLFFPAVGWSEGPPKAIHFNRDIRPLLARNCFPCHGPDADSRQADLRLDVREDAIAAGALDPDDLASSEILERIHTQDSELQMPPVEFGKRLTVEERELLDAWIRTGARYDEHWAFLPPQRSRVPTVDAEGWAQTPVDAFLYDAMGTQGLQPNPKADRYTLVRRLYLDLLGLIPTPEEADAFVQDQDPLAYERLVDRLLASPQYAEHWARAWLDLARYSDTNGYEKDRPRSIWPYRDWVVDAIDQDMPFDQFTIEQLAGDMLPQATIAQQIATGFHRNTMLNEEGGIDPLEYRFYAMVDRVATTGTVWMGLTLGCAQCHSHKYDPISHTDFYRFLALLNNADEPDLRFSRRPDSEATLAERLAKREDEMVRQVLDGEHQDEFSKWIQRMGRQSIAWVPARPNQLQSNLPKLERLDDESVFASGDFTKRDEYTLSLQLEQDRPITGLRLEALPDDRLPAAGPGRTYYEGRKGQFFLSELSLSVAGEPIEVERQVFSNRKSENANEGVLFDGNGSSGWTNDGRSGERHVVVIRFQTPLEANSIQVGMLFERHFVAALGRFRFSVTSDEFPEEGPDSENVSVSADVTSLFHRGADTWSASERRKVALEFLRLAPAMETVRKSLEQLRQQQTPDVETLVMQERPSDNPRKTFRHHRGEWLQPREEVTPNVPARFPQLPPEQANRLGLAEWLVSKENPLFARVFVNRSWQHFMADGLVRSDGDFGTQSVPPTHPELLDWLACEFVDLGMSRKKLHRLIVMSAAYQQAAQVSEEKRERDPTNRFYARGARQRVSGEAIRDTILRAANQLCGTMGGPSVRPPQPNSVTQIAYGNPSWSASTGEDRFRRSLYTFSKRTAPFAAFTTFDGPSGETCVARRNRSNTPLQALTLLNDEMFLELARHLAAAVNASDQDVDTLLATVFRSLLTRPPRADEIGLLRDYYGRQLARLQSGELSAARIMDRESASHELAALTLVARVVMNLDEMITKQ